MTHSGQMPNSIEAEAASWVAQLDSGLKTDADRMALQEWMARSPKHVAELKRMAALWGDIDLVIQAHIDQRYAPPTLGALLSSWLRAQSRQVYGLTASFVAVMSCVLLLAFFINGNYFVESYRQTYSVATGEQREILLADGSKLHLNTDSLVEVHYTRDVRILRLLKGEAHFDVAHEADRPFRVYAGPSLLTAIGTAFSVRLKPNDVSVIVTEGRVQLSDVETASYTSDDTNIVPAILAERSVIAAGESVEVDVLSREVNIIPSDNVKHQLAWRDGLVVFQNDSLQKVIDEVTRYTTISIVIADKNIRDTRFSGTFKTGEVMALLGALKSSFGIHVEFTNENIVYLTHQPDKPLFE